MGLPYPFKGKLGILDEIFCNLDYIGFYIDIYFSNMHYEARGEP